MSRQAFASFAPKEDKSTSSNFKASYIWTQMELSGGLISYSVYIHPKAVSSSQSPDK